MRCQNGHDLHVSVEIGLSLIGHEEFRNDSAGADGFGYGVDVHCVEGCSVDESASAKLASAAVAHLEKALA